MRIAQLDLLAYGPFRGLSIDLSAPGLHLVFGRNEAGKSTTLRAITGLLYGIDTRTRDAHVHKPADLRIGGTLLSEAGERVRVVRRKGNANTLLDDRGQALDDAVVLRLLRGIGEDTFRHAFGLDHETLRRGAHALLEGKGDLGESLFDASVGGGGEVQRLLAELSSEADAIWRPRASALPLNDALRAFTEAQKAVREKQSLPEAHLTQQRELEESQAAREEKLRERSAATRRRAQIERARRTTPLERRRDALAGERAALEPIERAAHRVDEILSRLAEHEHALERRRELAAELTRVEVRCEEAARHAGVHASPAPRETLRIDGPRESRIQRYVAERASLEGMVAKATQAIDRAEHALERLRWSEGPRRDLAAHATLQRAVDRARALGDLEERSAADRARLVAKQRDLAAKGAALGGHALELEALVAARVPSVGDVEALAKRAEAALRARGRIEELLVEHDRELAVIDGQIAEQTGDFTPPDAAELREARRLRDEAWASLKGEADGARRAPLEGALERATFAADATTDRMLAAADRVTMLARLRARRDHVVRARAKAAGDLESERARASAIEEELRGLFTPAGIAATSPEGMRAWLDKHERLVEAHAALREHESAVRHDEGRLAEAKRELALALGEPVSERLADLVAEALFDLAAADEARREAAENARALARTEEELRLERASLARDDAALAGVRAKLAELVAPLGLGDDASADEITRSLETTRELFAALDARSKIEVAARACEAELAVFAAEVAAVAKDAASDLASLPPLAAARALAERRARLAELARAGAEIEAQLAELGDEPIPEDVATLASDPEASSRALEDLDATLEVLGGELGALERRIGGIESGIAAMRGDSNAADAAADAQEALARVRVNAERWARAKLAAVLLGREIERYREENQGPLLGRASTLFARLTLGAYTGMRAGFDERDRPSLRLVRAGSEEVDVTGLSEGTRDQLYLALRLASLLRHAEVAEPMPLVLDDVLVHFDDERSAAALGVLAEAARTVQILFFTHHARLVELARDAVPAGELVVHELAARPSLTLAEAEAS